MELRGCNDDHQRSDPLNLIQFVLAKEARLRGSVLSRQPLPLLNVPGLIEIGKGERNGRHHT